MNEVLIALGRSASDPDAVLDSIVESVRRLCRCEAAAIMLDRGGTTSSCPPRSASRREYVSYVSEHPFQLDRATLIGRVTADRKIQQIPDVLTDPEYGRQDVQRIVRFRTVMAARCCSTTRSWARCLWSARRSTRSTIAPSRSSAPSRRRPRSSCATSTSCARSRSAGGTGAQGRAARGAQRGRRGWSARAWCSTRCSRTSS